MPLAPVPHVLTRGFYPRKPSRPPQGRDDAGVSMRLMVG